MRESADSFRVESTKVNLREAALLRIVIVGSELGHHAALLPNLDIVAVNELLGGLDCCAIVRTV